MTRYFRHLRVKRLYKWVGAPTSYDRKTKVSEYEGLNISLKGLPRITMIRTGQFILIEGDDDDNPYVAKVIKLFDNQRQKKAIVQWFVRASEVPPDKLMLLDRDPHPQEVFYSLGHNCNNEIEAESILRTVEVKHLSGAEKFPEAANLDTLYVKLSWDTKAFRVCDAALIRGAPAPSTHPPGRPKPPLMFSPPPSPPAKTPVSHGRAHRALPTPDPTIMRAAGSVAHSRSCMSVGKMGTNEAESLHSASKHSAAKQLSAKRRGNAAGTPGVRKKLELFSTPGKRLSSKDVLLDEDLLESEIELAQRLSSSPPRTLPEAYSLSPIGCRSRVSTMFDGFPLLPQPSTVRLERLPLVAMGEEDSTRELLGVSTLEDDVFEAGPLTSSAKTPRKRQATPRRIYALRPHRAVTPVPRKDSSKALKASSLTMLAEVEDESSPLQMATTLRSSKRKCAQQVSSRIRKQLDLVNHLRFNSDGESSDDSFVPSKKNLENSSEDEEEVDSDTVPKRSRQAVGTRTPHSTRKTRASASTPCKTLKTKATPGTPRTPQTPRHATPSIPTRTLPARLPGNVLEEARARLHVSSVPESLPCREQEFQDIYNFVESKVMDGTGGCMYISGVPGTGKTATVHEVVRCLQHASDSGDLPAFRFIEVNGMKMTDPHQTYVQVLQKLTGQKATADHAAALLEKRFSKPDPKKVTTVLLVDELDLLWTRKQNVMYNLFDWPTRRHAHLVVLTIANTMDLPERIMINRVASRLGLTRMSFQPYSFGQLQQIITSRLNKIKAFEEDALQLVSRKVAALSGDARRCLDICRRATEICEHSTDKPSASGLVGMSHVMKALDEMFSSSYITAVRCSSVQEKLFLRAVLAEFRRLGLEEATFQQVFVQHQALCRVEGLPPISVSESLAVCQRLGACRLLLLEASRLDVLQRVRLNVSQDDVLFALKAD